ncbi:MAG: hypothetical protein J6A79_01770 [Clostridia bacterium]|nr:hypothetical protein [Clostridia bacterium]
MFDKQSDSTFLLLVLFFHPDNDEYQKSNGYDNRNGLHTFATSPSRLAHIACAVKGPE